MNTNEGKTLHLHLKYEYFDEIKSGAKKEEYREAERWEEKLCRNNYTKIRLYRGYSPVSPATILDLPYKGFIFKKITHPHFGPDEIAVCAIDVSGEPIVD